jgi:hypothetical protein
VVFAPRQGFSIVLTCTATILDRAASGIRADHARSLDRPTAGSYMAGMRRSRNE